MRVDVEADPKVVEAAEAAGEVVCGQGGHDAGVQGGRPDGKDQRVCGLGLGRGPAAAQEHTGGSVVVGGIAVNSWSPTQRGRSLSSAAEAEYYAIVTGAAEALAVQALAEEMGLKMSARVHTDASAARAVACRRGLRKLRHIELKY